MFVRHVFQLGLANIAAQVLSLLVIPLLTRLYSPMDYGAFAIYLAILNTAVPIASLRYHAALVLPRDEAEARGLFTVALWVTGLIALGLWLAIAVVQWRNMTPVDWEQVGATSLLWMIPFNVAAVGLVQLFSSRLMARQQYHSTAVGRIAESLGDRGVSCLLGFAHVIPHAGLSIGRLMGSGLTALYLWRSVSALPTRAATTLAPHALVELASRYRHFALVSSWAALCDAAARQAPAIILAIWFSPITAGYYMLAFQVVNVPIMIAGDALASTFFQRAAASRDQPEKLKQDTLRLFRAMLCLIIPLTLVLMFLGKPAFQLVFGPSWQAAGRFAELLSIGFLFMFLHRPLSVLFDVFQAQTARLWFDAANLILRVTVMIALARLAGDPEAVLAGFTMTSTLVYGLGLLYLLRTVGIPLQCSLSTVAGRVAVYIPFGCALWAALWLETFPRSGIPMMLMALGLQAFLLFRFETQTFHLMAFFLPSWRRPT